MLDNYGLICPLVGVDEEKDEDENDEIMNDGMNEDENTKEKNIIKKCNDSIGENTKEEELRNTLYSKILDEVLQDANLNTSEKTRKDLKQNNQTSYYSEEFEKPNFTLEDSHDLLISWLVRVNASSTVWRTQQRNTRKALCSNRVPHR